MKKFKIESVNISEKKGTQKHEVSEIHCIEGHGIEGDAHAGNWHRQVSFLAGEAVDTMKDRIKSSGSPVTIESGTFAENIVTRGIDWKRARAGGKITVNHLELEVTQIGKECHAGCAIYDAAGECIMPGEGIFARVLKGGKIRAGDTGEYQENE